ncbi:MAG TPA: aminotransferase class III-fold pyridoxal phosphate-dependent enzyme [Candidatus Binatia bacterium]|nr:aminotransferase class III-fold pyridoxal phosphate-dependent enzyme [Candidatus Binatia bacterium]
MSRNGARTTAGNATGQSSAVDAYGHGCRPGLVRLLSAIGLDVVYERAQGDTLWLRRDGRLVPILDLVGGYGANLFGHHHPDLVAVARRCFDEQTPFHAQASIRPGAGRLAEALCRRLGDYVVILTNSGTETIEAALKHALLERRRPTFWAVRGAFHGKTLGSIQFTWSYRGPYEGLGPRVRFLDPDDPRDWESAAAHVDDVAALLLEPIAGEGGIRPLPAPFVAWVRTTCRAAGVPVIADEIQSGMGRTGTFLAAEALGIEPDYVCLAKSLGGGIAKVGALLVRRSRFVEEFSLKHTSTFAEDDYGCAIALEALRLLDRGDLLARCRARGEFLVDALRRVQARFPDQVKDVRGLGLMVGFELRDRSDATSYTLRMLSRQDYLGYVAAAYLLNAHDVRVTPSLGDPRTLRLEPSAYVSEEALTRFVRGAEALCELLRAENVARLTGHTLGFVPSAAVDYSAVARPDAQEEPRTPRRVGFIGHLLLDEHATLIDPSYRAFGKDRLEEYLDRTGKVVDPIVFDRVHVRSKTGDEVHLSFVGLLNPSRQFARAMHERDSRWITDKIETAVQIAKAAGCGVVGFGGYTSIVTASCRRVRTNGVALTTGNSLTVGMGVAALRAAARQQGIDLAASRLAVLGATGNIASTYAALMAPEIREVVLVVRNLRSSKLGPVLAGVRAAAPNVAVRAVDDLAALADCPLIVAASSTPQPLIYPEHLGPGPAVICDISLPSNVADAVTLECPNVLVVQGGVVRLPLDDDFAIGGIPLARGHVYACMAETLLMGLEGLSTHGSIGPVTVEGVRRAMAMAEKHGFALGDIHENGAASGLMGVGYARHHRHGSV